MCSKLSSGLILRICTAARITMQRYTFLKVNYIHIVCGKSSGGLIFENLHRGAHYDAEVHIVQKCVAASCSVLQCVAVCCSALQCVAVRCSVLQCVAVCCSAFRFWTMGDTSSKSQLYRQFV